MSDVSPPPGVKSSFLRRKVGGIPVVYLLGAAVVVLAIVAYRMRANSAADDAAPTDGAAPADTASDTSDLSQTDGGDNVAFAANPVPTYGTSNAAPGDVGNASVEDNSTWLKKSVEWAVKNGQSAGTVTEALQKYLNGDQLSYDQGIIRDKCVKQFGLPPDGFTQGKTLGKTSTAVRKNGNPPTVHTVQGVTDNTYGKIAALYYGGANTPDMVENMMAANMRLGTLNRPMPMGTKVSVPAFRGVQRYKTTKTVNTAVEVAKKNGISTYQLAAMNPGVTSPYKPGTSLRIA